MKIKDKSGFTLIEVIMSIALLSIASVIVMQLFVTSGNLNGFSRDIDQAGVFAANQLEMMKVMKLEEIEGMDENSSIFFDDEWNRVDQADTYEMAVSVEKDQSYSGLYQLTVTVFEVDRETPLIAYQTKHYYKD